MSKNIPTELATPLKDYRHRTTLKSFPTSPLFLSFMDILSSNLSNISDLSNLSNLSDIAPPLKDFRHH
jgi:hypothetical protein